MDSSGSLVKAAANVAIESTTVDGGSKPLYAEWYIPEAAAKNGVMLYLHGGSYRVGSCQSHRGFVTHIVKAAGIRTLLPEYRLAPEHPFPAALEDARAVYEGLLDEGHRPDEIFVVGDSAGGGLTLALLLSLRDDARPLPNSAVVISPWTDLASTGESMRTRAKQDPWLDAASSEKGAKRYYADDSPLNPLVSPLYGNYKHIPPLLIHVGTHEILLDDSTRLAKKAKADGVQVTLKIYQGMWHVWHAFVGRNIPECERAIAEIGAFIKNQLEKIN
ncbi:MAG: monoterpene epsilon-lactone hydrolase [Candidatus Promineifilaceae bacterium]|jgi:monoterpene epsilon-lactone hydrolase